MKYNCYVFCMLIFFLSAGKGYADEFIPRNFRKAPNDVTAIKEKRLNVNDEGCALIKIRSDIQGVKFDARLGIEGDVQFKNGEYLVYISPGEKVLTFIKDGFIRKEFPLPISIESLAVYKMELTGSERYSITIKTEPIDAFFQFDGVNQESGKTILDVTPGSHIVKIEQTGYKEIIDTVFVSKEKTYFNYSLEALKQIPVRITTTPEGANVMVNNISYTTTPTDVFVFPGNAKILLTKNLYRVVDTTIKITEQTKSVHIPMESITGTYTISSSTPGIKLFIDNKLTKLGTGLITEGRHIIHASAEGYDSFDTIFTLKTNQTFVKSIDLVQQTGDLQVTAKPFDANFELIKQTTNSAGKTTNEIIRSWSGTKLIEGLPVGTYLIKATYPGHNQVNDFVKIEKNKATTISIELLATRVSEGSKAKAIAWSAFVPGAGQLYSNQLRGWIYMPAFYGLLGTAVVFHTDVIDYNNALQDYKNATDNIEHFRTIRDEKYEIAVSSAKTRNMLIYAAGAVYLINLVDAYLLGGKKISSEASILKPLNNMNLTCVPVDGKPTIGIIYQF